MARPAHIKIGHQDQADLPIYLSCAGTLICGAFKYSSRPKKEHLSGMFSKIRELVPHSSDMNILDVSDFQYWDALNIFEEHIAKPWNKSVSAEQLERLSIETQVFLMLEPVREMFKKAVRKRWRRISKSYSVDDPNRPGQGWQILTQAEQDAAGNPLPAE